MSTRSSGRTSDLHSLTDLLGPTLERLGVDDLSTLLAITEEWPTLAGSAWAEHTRPVVLRRRTLVVEVTTPAAVRLVKFGEQELIRSLQARFGPDSVTALDVVAPSR